MHELQPVHQMVPEGQVGVEEDYATCVRLLARGQADKPAGAKKRGRKSDQPELGL